MDERAVTLYYAEDDKAIAEAVREYLAGRGCRVTVFAEAEALKRALQIRRPDVVILDWNLPQGSVKEQGDEICRWIRARWKELPVLFLTVREEPADMLAGFRSGADDYVTKPFDLEVLCARIRALLRRAGQQKEHSFCCDALTLDAEKMQVFSGEKEIALSRAEYQILLLLMENKGRTVTRGQLLEQIWDSEGNYVNDNTLTVTMKRIREKLGHPSCLKTVRSFGYRMEDSL